MSYQRENVELYFVAFKHEATASELAVALENDFPTKEPITETRFFPINARCSAGTKRPNGIIRIGEVFGWTAARQILFRSDPAVEWDDPTRIPQVFLLENGEKIRYGIVEEMLPLTEKDFQDLLK